MSTITTELPEVGRRRRHGSFPHRRTGGRNGTETTKASIEAARSYIDDASTIGRDLLNTWSTRVRPPSRPRSRPRTPRSALVSVCST